MENNSNENEDSIQLHREFDSRSRPLTCVLCYPKQNRVVSSSFDNTIGFWNYESGVCLKKVRVNNEEEMENSLMKYDCKIGEETFLSCGDAGEINQWSVLKMEKIRTIIKSQGRAFHRMLRIEKDMIVCTDGYNGIILTYNVKVGKEVHSMDVTIDTDLAPLIPSRKYKNVFYTGLDCSDNLSLLKYELDWNDWRVGKVEVWKEYSLSQKKDTFSTYDIYVNRDDKEILLGATYGRMIAFFDTTSPTNTPPFKEIQTSLSSIRAALTCSTVFKDRDVIFGGDDGSIVILSLIDDYDFKLIKHNCHNNMIRGVTVTDGKSRRNEVMLMTWSDNGVAREFSILNGILKGGDEGEEEMYRDLAERTNYLFYQIMEEEENREFYDVVCVSIHDITPFYVPRITFFM